MQRVFQTAAWVIATAGLTILAGCHGTHSKHTPPPDQETTIAPVRGEADDLEDLAHDVQRASDRVEEGAALKRLQQWQIDHGTTFKLEADNADTKVAAPSPSTYAGPLLAHITVFRGQQPIYRFEWIPKDNGNLALLGQ